MKSCLVVYVIAALLCECALSRADTTGCDAVEAHSTCSCQNDYRQPEHLIIECSSMDMTRVPNQFPGNVLTIDFSNNFLASDRISDFCKYKLKHLSIANNHMTKIPENQFSECKVIDSLDLGHNDIEELPEESLEGLQSLRALIGIQARKFERHVFSGLTSLVYLNIVIQQLPIPSDLFAGLSLVQLEMVVNGALQIPVELLNPVSGTLQTLVISSDTLQWIRDQQLAKLAALKNFTLSGTSIRQIPHSLFQNNKNLETVYLSGMAGIPRKIFDNMANLVSIKLQDLEDMPSELFQGLFSIRSLEVSNSIEEIIPDNWFYDLFSLEKLILKDNGLSTLKEGDFINLRSLKVLDLSENAIRELKNGVIAEVAETLEVLDLSHNDLKLVGVRNFAGAHHLQVLDLSNNHITAVEPGAFSDLLQLQVLKLTSNKIYELSPGLFGHNAMLKAVTLADNVLASIPDGLFMNTTLLQSLDLSENIIRNFGPYSHYPTQPLAEVNFMYNPVDCDCDLYWFLQAIPNTRVHGVCRLSVTGTSIADFRASAACRQVTSTSTISTTTTAASQTPVTQNSTDPRIVVWLNQTQAPTSSDTSVQTNAPNQTHTSTSSNKVLWFNQTQAPTSSDTSAETTAPESTRTNVSSDSDQTEAATAPTSSVNHSRVSVNASSTATLTSSTLVASNKATDSSFKDLPDSETSFNLSDSQLALDKSDALLVPQEIRMSTKSPAGSNLNITSKNVPNESEGENQMTTKMPNTEIVTKQNIPESHSTKSVPADTRGLGGNSSGYTVIPSLHSNITLDPGKAIVYQSVTAESHRIAVISIVGVAVLCVLIIIGLVWKRRRRRRFDVSRIISAFGDRDVTVETEIKPLKDVPSITIEKIDAEDNVKVEVYEP